jgi:2-oxoisovalerate dehydrogenase E1 component alpha subunit
VYAAPVVFVVQNNGYAISVPYRLQTKASSIALRAAGVGMPGIRVDGNDVVSVYGAVKTAVDRARRGEGPTLVEAVTYRLEAHTTADDTSRYRSDDEAAEWRARDPVEGFLRVLREGGVVDDALLAEVEAEGEATAARMRDFLFDAPAGDPREMFDHVYATPTAQLESQRALLAHELQRAEES